MHVCAGMSIRLAIAEGNALGKGPLVFHIRPPLIAAICVKAARGDEDAQILERALFRCVGLLGGLRMPKWCMGLHMKSPHVRRVAAWSGVSSLQGFVLRMSARYHVFSQL